MNCSYCRDAGWTCEQHPWLPWPHDTCPGPGRALHRLRQQAVADKPIQPVEFQWSLWKSGRRVDWELRFHGESYGWEFCLIENGTPTFGMRFITHDGAARAAEGERVRLLGGRLDGQRLDQRLKPYSADHP
jgi:hypothetical protein